MEEELDIVTFSDEEGNEYELEIIDTFTHEGKDYALLVDPASAQDEEAEVEVYIMRAETEGDVTTFMAADDDVMDALTEIAGARLDLLAAEMEAEAGECGCGEDDCDCGCH